VTELVVAAGVVAALAFSRSSRRTEKVWGYVAGHAELLELLDVGVTAKGKRAQLRVDAGEAFLRMKAAAAGAGVELVINRAFSTWDEQLQFYELWQQGKGPQAAPPGYSDHQAGLAVDLESGGGANAAFAWLTVYAGNFGFKRTVASEPWHWEYA
jgi:LAS superfamily LD-carboxypeptidase LdcB